MPRAVSEVIWSYKKLVLKACMLSKYLFQRKIEKRNFTPAKSFHILVLKLYLHVQSTWNNKHEYRDKIITVLQRFHLTWHVKNLHRTFSVRIFKKCFLSFECTVDEKTENLRSTFCGLAYKWTRGKWKWNAVTLAANASQSILRFLFSHNIWLPGGKRSNRQKNRKIGK